MSTTLRRDRRDDRIRQFRWKNWMDITSLLGVTLIVGGCTWLSLLALSDIR